MEAQRERAAKLRQQVVADLCGALGSGERAWIIGSVASGYFGPHSDIDVVTENCSVKVAFALWNHLCQRFGLPVDLMRIEELPENFARRVRSEGILVHGT